MVSPKRDSHQALFDLLREARLNRHLTQQELARKLGLHQRQISDLERAAIDPRLSTIQNVARALDLELTLIPRYLIPAMEALHRAGSDSVKRPMYALGDESSESDTDNPSDIEIERARGSEGSRARQRPGEKEPQ